MGCKIESNRRDNGTLSPPPLAPPSPLCPSPLHFIDFFLLDNHVLVVKCQLHVHGHL